MKLNPMENDDENGSTSQARYFISELRFDHGYYGFCQMGL